VINADGSGETVLWVSPDYRSVEAPDWGP